MTRIIGDSCGPRASSGYTRLSTAGYRFTSPPTDQSWPWREATLVDPDGQQLCLFHAGVNAQIAVAPGRISVSQAALLVSSVKISERQVTQSRVVGL
ncbi:MAG TPA: hypothetical protein VF488_08375 [Gemmatimonadaceae bacterium]